jgi:predicted acylesterase/phospholipase RssA
LRSYRNTGGFGDNPTIWEAALATSAAPTFFDPVQIGVRRYVDGAIGANNPVSEVEDEASNIWCDATGKLEPLVKCFISIGTGDPGKQPIHDRLWRFLAEDVVKVATETREMDDRFTGRWRAHLDTRYFRFNVQQGLQGIGLAEYLQEAKIYAATCEYLDGHSLKRRVRDCVENLRHKKCR